MMDQQMDEVREMSEDARKGERCGGIGLRGVFDSNVWSGLDSLDRGNVGFRERRNKFKHDSVRHGQGPGRC